jgi:hypothetical protein
MKTEYYAEGSIYELRNGEHLKKDSFKMFSPDGKKININIDLNGDKMFVRNAKIEQFMPMQNKHVKTVMPIRSFKPSLIQELKKMEKKEKKDVKPKKNIKSKTVKLKKNPKISPKRNSILRKKIKTNTKDKQKSAKNQKKPKKTIKSKNKVTPKPITAQSPPENSQQRASYLSNTFL